jgi:hypothetical protein
VLTDFGRKDMYRHPASLIAPWQPYRGTPLLLVAKNLGHADPRLVQHLASSSIVDAIYAAAPKFGFTPNASVAPLRD